MAYLAFYRAFRPKSFDEVVRQEHIVRILKNQIADDKVGHAYLFCGPRGTGKTTLAKIFARAINCENPQNGSPCGVCPACRALSEGSNLDISEIDAASNNGVDEMRDLREKVQYPPVAGRYKVYIIDEVHMLTASAFNAVLKTLEEPPRHAVFILATTEPQKIPATILSRCMRFDFKLIPQSDLESLVKSVLGKAGKEYENEAVSAIARAGAGSARDSLSIADMCASYSRGKLTYADVNAVLGGAEHAEIAHICDSILKEELSEALTAVEKTLSSGRSTGVLIKHLLSYLNDVTIVKVCKNAREIINLPEESYNTLVNSANLSDGHKLLRVTEILSKLEADLRYSLNERISLETAVLKCALPEEDYNIDALIGKISAIERKIEGLKLASAPLEPAPAPVRKPEKEPQPQSVTEKVKPVTEAPQPKPEKETPPAPKKLLLAEDDDNPFSDSAKKLVQSDITFVAPGVVRSSGEVFAKLLKSLRTTRKNAVLFTLCMDLEHTFEDNTLVLFSDSEPVLKALTRPDNAKLMAEILAEIGVINYEIRLKAKGENAYDKALSELKNNFKGTDITEK